ncbi:MAG: glycerophosphodiester phosphodiesterase [Calditrichia bacterium]|nr:glycerophosphodiester phosphodiesterase [Calditrichia bacterium]
MEIFAHRGLHNKYPENSESAVKAAIEEKILAIEIDIRRCKTGEVILFHDRRLKRKAGYSKYVIHTPYDVISNLNLSGYNPPQRIPLLKEVLSKFGSSINIILDIKKETWMHDGLEENLVDMVKELGLMDKTIFSSFNYFVVKRIAKLASDAQVGLIVAHPLQIELFNMDYFTSFHLNYRHLPKINMNKLKKSGKKIYVWTLDEPEICSRLLKRYPIDGIITDNPVEIKKRLNKNRKS